MGGWKNTNYSRVNQRISIHHPKLSRTVFGRGKCAFGFFEHVVVVVDVVDVVDDVDDVVDDVDDVDDVDGIYYYSEIL
jgi:hypothetical protein